MHNCSLCGTPDPRPIFRLQNAPAFQNKTYATLAAAQNAILASVDIVQCKQCGFTWNQAFDPSLMDYDESYQNEQGCSKFFQEYLLSILDIIKKHAACGERVVEVGCGKAKFLKMLRDTGFEVTGFDPAHEDNEIGRAHV